MFLKKLKIELPYDPAILLLGIYAEKMKTLIQKEKDINELNKKLENCKEQKTKK